MRLNIILRSLKIPILLSLYAIVWLSLQPFIIRLLSTSYLGTSKLGNVISVTVYFIINVGWLYSWYRLAKEVRNRALVKHILNNEKR